MIQLVFSLLLSFLISLYSLFEAFRCWKKKRFIEDIPSSKIRSLPMGLVEVSGKAISKNSFKAPFSGWDCAFYKYIVEVSSGDDRSWRLVQQGSSEHQPFYLEDETGRCFVLPTGAQLKVSKSFSKIFHPSHGIPGWIRDHLERWKIPHTDLFGNDRKMRIQEFAIRDQEQIYVIGRCHDVRHLKTIDNQAQIGEQIQALKANPEMMKEFDTDGDDQISPAEWQEAVRAIESSVESEKKSSSADNELLYISDTDDRNQIFIIANKPESELISKISFSFYSYLFIGTAAAVGFVTLLFFL